MADGTLGGLTGRGKSAAALAAEKYTGKIAERIARRARSSGWNGTSWVRGSPSATLFVLLAVFFAVSNSTLREQYAPAHACSAVSPAGAAGPGALYPTMLRQRRSSLKPSWSGLLLASCLVSGDIEPNPGPGGPGRDVTLLLQNVQSIKNKLGDLRQSAAELDKFSIVAMTETWLNGTVESAELESALPTHTLLRRDRVCRVGGGVACFVSNALNPMRREALEPKDAEMLVVEARTTPPLLLAVCYCPPDDTPALTTTMSALYNIVAAASGKSIVAVGDFKVPDITWKAAAAGWAEPVMAWRTRRALELLDGCHLAGLRQHVALPSRGANYLDLVLSNGLDITTTVRDGVFSSDHSEVVCEFRAVRGPLPVVSRKTALNYKRADWDGLRAVLSLTPWSVLDDLPVDDAVTLFYDLLSAAISDHIPLVQLKRRQSRWFDRTLHGALREKEAAHRRMKRNRTIETIELFREKLRDFKRLSSARFYEYLKGLTDDLRTNPKRFWTFLKSIKGKHGEMSFLTDGDQKVGDDKAKAELLNKAFATKFTDPTVCVFPLAPDYMLDRLCAFHESEDIVRETLRSVDRFKACGPDNISGRVVRECAEELAVPVAKLCRLSFEQGVFPKQWKCANIVPIHKKGAKTIAANYRSVSLLPIFSKVLERIVFTTLYNHVKPALSDRQHGFMPGRSCATNLCTMLETAWSNISAGSQTDVIYTDYSSAFQSVNHKLLLHKLKFSFHVSDQALNWLKSYLSGRRQRVVVKGKCSQWTEVLSGTPEGIKTAISFAVRVLH